MKGTYLLINFLTILFPLLLSFDKKVHFYTRWKHLFPALLLSGIVFLFWDHLFTVYEVWSFNPDHIIGLYLFELPIEEILFFLTVPFACVFVYECLNAYVRRDLLRSATPYLTGALILLCIVLLLKYHDRVYSLITFGLLGAMLLFVQFAAKPVWLSRFYLAFIVSLIPFYLVNGLLTSIPVVLYNDAENMAFRIGTIPLEDHFYSLAMLLLNVYLYEYFKKRENP